MKKKLSLYNKYSDKKWDLTKTYFLTKHVLKNERRNLVSKKITWNKVFEDFKVNYPKLRTKAVWWGPCDFMTITIYMADGRKGVYDGLKHRFKYTNEMWKCEKGKR